MALHSLRAANPEDIATLRVLVGDRDIPVHIHIAEQQQEVRERARILRVECDRPAGICLKDGQEAPAGIAGKSKRSMQQMRWAASIGLRPI